MQEAHMTFWLYFANLTRVNMEVMHLLISNSESPRFLEDAKHITR